MVRSPCLGYGHNLPTDLHTSGCCRWAATRRVQLGPHAFPSAGRNATSNRRSVWS